jgi:membrane-associated protease RseP (regulator of RpoE activity)
MRLRHRFVPRSRSASAADAPLNPTVLKKETIMRLNKCALSQLALTAVALLPIAALASEASSQSAKDSARIIKALKSVPGFTALPVKKGGSGVEISYRIDGTPAPGTPLIVQLTVSSRTEAQVRFRAGEGLVVNGSNGVLMSAAGQITQHRVEVTPQAQGRFYLYLESSANGRGSASAIAVQVGKTDVQRKPAGNVQSMPDGERVISVPAKQ